MKTYIIDLDGTIVWWGSSKILPGAAEYVRALIDEGHKVIFMTARPFVSPDFDNDELLANFRKAKLNTVPILWDCPSPRTLINDEEAFVIKREKNQAWIGEVK